MTRILPRLPASAGGADERLHSADELLHGELRHRLNDERLLLALEYAAEYSPPHGQRLRKMSQGLAVPIGAQVDGVRNLGRRAEPLYPLRPRCEECHRVIPDPLTAHLHPSHFPWCSKATREQMRLWQDRKRLRELRTARRIGDG